MFKYLDRGKTHADNLIDNLLSFNISSTWTTVGEGTALIDNNEYFEGSGSLKLTNYTYKTMGLTANNSVQSTVIPFDGIYDFSLYLKKTLAEDMSIDLQIFKGESQIYGENIDPNQIITFRAEYVDNWTSFITNENFSLTKGEVITFVVKLKKNASSAQTSVNLWLDGLHLYNKERNQIEAPIYSKPIARKTESFGVYDYSDSGVTQSINAATWTHLLNDGAGSLTSNTYGLTGIENIFDVSTGLLDFSDLNLGDKVEFRITGDAVTSGANQTLMTRFKGAIGTASEYTVLFNTKSEFKKATTHQTSYSNFITIDNDATKDNGARFEIYSDRSLDYVVDGFKIIVHKR